MGVESIREGATNPVIPFIGEADLSLGLVVALFAGLFLIAFVRPASENAADWVGNQMGDRLGVNPQTGQTGGNTAAFGGA